MTEQLPQLYIPKETWINNVLRYQKTYDGDSRVSEVVDVLAAQKYRYEYDILGRFVGERLIQEIVTGDVHSEMTQTGEEYLLFLHDEAGTKVVEYSYDVWGVPLTVTGTLADTIGQKNPIRYRGYYYDSETEFYYLNTRYYDPEIGRFINADGYVSTGQGVTGYNMFAYCLNNPINRVDYSGDSSTTFATWAASMWWLCGIDTALPVGDIIYVGGLAVLGIMSAYSQTKKLLP